ncbi:MAG: two pore domain potassium channel family protein [Bacteroidetes bacterium]|nr:two pore domain potassium channel family protein [Bacteroidota bacterium]
MFLDKNSFLRNKNHQRLIIGTLVTLIVGSTVYHYSENWSWIDSIYFSVITLTTVGYGDFSPQTDFGKIFTIFYVLTGIGLIFGFINEFYQFRKQNNKKSLDRKQNNNKS